MNQAFLNIEMPKQKVDINVEEVRDLPDLLENNLTCRITFGLQCLLRSVHIKYPPCSLVTFKFYVYN